ncbi:MAG: flagellar basal body-associated FliL family protein [Succinivibrio sp.]|nr:flagellar basal body-associated FliL family protein [Succinivibrio sp.]
MAKKKKEEADGDDLEAPKRGKGLLIVILLLVLILLGGGGYMGAAFFLNLPPFEVEKQTTEELAAIKAAKEAELEAEQHRDYFIKFETPFTFNLTDKKRQHSAQIEIVLVVSGSESEDIALKNQPLLSSTIFSTISNQSYTSMLMPSGRARLKLLLLDALRAKMSEVARNPVVEQVLFTGFVMQ